MVKCTAISLTRDVGVGLARVRGRWEIVRGGRAREEGHFNPVSPTMGAPEKLPRFERHCHVPLFLSDWMRFIRVHPAASLFCIRTYSAHLCFENNGFSTRSLSPPTKVTFVPTCMTRVLSIFKRKQNSNRALRFKSGCYE